MAFISRKLAKALVLAILCSLFFCQSQVSCVKHYLVVGNINYCYDDVEKCLHVCMYDRGIETEIKRDDFENFMAGKDVKSVSIEDTTERRDKFLYKILNRKGLCNNLAGYVISLFPDTSPTDSLRKIGRRAFSGCLSLESIRISKNVTEIGKSAFSNCRSLREVQLPDSLRKISDSAFRCSALKSANIPKNVTEIEEEAFRECKSLEKVELPDSLRRIGALAFKECLALKSIRIPKNVDNIDSEAFAGCTSLEEVQLPDSSFRIGNGAFMKCAALKSIIVPKRVTKIGEQAFAYCNSLKVAYVPADAKIGEYAFPSTTNVIRY